MIYGFWITHLRYRIQSYFPLTPATLNKSPPSAVKRVLEGQADADTVQCFYWPNEKPLCVSRGLELRLGSLLSAFISVSFAISLSLVLSPSLALLLSLSLSLTPPFFSNSLAPSLLLFSPEELEKKMSQDQISGSLQHCLSASVCLFHRVIESLMEVSRSLFMTKLYFPQVWHYDFAFSFFFPDSCCKIHLYREIRISSKVVFVYISCLNLSWMLVCGLITQSEG